MTSVQTLWVLPACAAPAGAARRCCVGSRSRRTEFRFHLKAADGEIIASSLRYKPKAAAEKGIESVKTSA